MVDEVGRDDLDVEIEDVQDGMQVGLRWVHPVEDGDVAVGVLHVELPNPDVEDVHVLVDVIPNLFVVDDLDVEAMLVEGLHVDVIQHLEDEVDHVQNDVFCGRTFGR